MFDLLSAGGWGNAAIALSSGTVFGIIFGLIPGLGGRLGVLVLLPIASLFDPYSAAIFLFAMHAVVHTSSAIPPIAFGLPTGSSDLATYMDGYPLARMGRAAEALGASLSASAIGGVLGAIAFLASIPFARSLVTSFGPPEFFMLAVFGVTMVSSLSREGLLPGLVVAILGAILAMVGFSDLSAAQRFTFGVAELWDGLNLVALICGIYVVPEMLTLKTIDEDRARRSAYGTTIHDVFRGMFVTFRYMAVVLRSTLIGIVIGIVPAVGSSVAVWLSYGYAARTTKSEIPFGQGAIAGVIAPEAANNSKEGGAMIPTLFFGIPGSSTMAIMIAALTYVGVTVGPNMLGRDIGLSYALAATIFLANLIAIPFFFATIPGLVRLSALKHEAIAPIAISLSVMSALIGDPSLATGLQILAASVVGIALRIANWPRAPFVLGFVMSHLAETAFHQTMNVWGWQGFFRPISLVMLLFVIGWLLYSWLRRSNVLLATHREATIALAPLLGAFFVAIAVGAALLPRAAGLLPLVLSLIGGTVCVVILVMAMRRPSTAGAERPSGVMSWGLYIASVPIVGLVPASAAFIATMLRRQNIAMGTALLTALCVAAAEAVVLASVLDVPIEKEIVGRLIWYYLGY